MTTEKLLVKELMTATAKIKVLRPELRYQQYCFIVHYQNIHPIRRGGANLTYWWLRPHRTIYDGKERTLAVAFNRWRDHRHADPHHTSIFWRERENALWQSYQAALNHNEPFPFFTTVAKDLLTPHILTP